MRLSFRSAGSSKADNDSESESGDDDSIDDGEGYNSSTKIYQLENFSK
jgi:hypothetical protein